MSLPALHTARLRLDPLAEEHAEYLVALNSDPDVMRYVGPVQGRAESLAQMPDLVSVPEPFGFWTGFEGTDFAGVWCVTPDPPDATAGELSYRLPTSAWGRGLATEGARAMVDHAFGDAGLTTVWSGTMPGNAASVSVLTGLGFCPSDRATEDDEIRFALERDAWRP